MAGKRKGKTVKAVKADREDKEERADKTDREVRADKADKKVKADRKVRADKADKKVKADRKVRAEKKVKKKKSAFAVVLHPFLFALYPALFLFGHNAKEAMVGNVVVPAVLSLIFGAFLFGVLWIFMRNVLKAGISASFILILVFSYGHIFEALEEIIPAGSYSVKHIILMAASAALFFFLIREMLKSGKLSEINLIMNFGAAVVFGMALFQSVYAVNAYHSQVYSGLSKKISKAAAEARQTGVAAGKPDIYFIILDGHSNHEIMKEMYGYDDSHFYEFLRNEGFYTADKARSNYCQTFLSLSATMHMKYHAPRGGAEPDDGTISRVFLGDMIRHNPVIETLRKNGYIYASYFTGFVGTEMRAISDIYLPPGKVNPVRMNEFESVFFNTTILRGIAGIVNIGLDEKAGPHRAYSRRTQYVLEHLPESASLTSPKFVLAHILAPHPPFVFDENGPTDKYVGTKGVAFHDGTLSRFPKEDYVKAYAAQAKYIHKKVKETIKKLKAATKGEAVIIIQADHGAGAEWDINSMEKTNLKERFGILSAYYLPDGADKLLYPEITPVNNFRLIFKHYLGLDYELLEDKSYYSTWERPFEFVAVESAIDR